MPVDPDQMIAMAKRDGETAVGGLLAAYRNYLLVLARLQVGRQLQRKFDASDLVQETMLEAHRHFAQFEGRTEPQFLSWLRQILAAKASNLVRHYLGTQARNAGLEQELADSFHQSAQRLESFVAASVSSPSQQVVRREMAVLLADALERLPPDYREVLVLRHFEGLAFSDVSERMQRSVDSVQKLWIRALARLRQNFGESQ